MIDTNEIRKALLKHQPQTDPSAIELTRFMATIADELDLLSGLLKAEQEDCELQRKNKIMQWERAETAEREVQRLKKESDQILNDAIANIDRKAARIKELESAVIKALNDNRHLADGENCTLIDLKRAMPTWGLE